MTMLIRTLAAVAAGGMLVTSAFAQSARDVRGPTPYDAIDHAPEPGLILDPTPHDQLARGVFRIQYRVENVPIVPVFGMSALNVSPRVGHLHITIDEQPWHWADAGDNKTNDLVGLPPDPHKALIELVNAEHQPFTEQTVTFTVPEGEK